MEDAAKRLNKHLYVGHSDLVFQPQPSHKPGKTKLLLMGTRRFLSALLDDFHVTLLSKDIYPVPSAKDLGIILDSFLTYDNHIITEVVSNCLAASSLPNQSCETFAGYRNTYYYN